MALRLTARSITMPEQREAMNCGVMSPERTEMSRPSNCNGMSRRRFIASVGAAAAVAGAQRAWGRQGETKPNIIVMMADDFGFECLSCNGGGPYKTPNIDALAAGGVRFTNCHAQPLCTPSRVKIMTGRYNFRNYITFGLLDAKEKTFAAPLKKAGYTTCVVGKWQIGCDLKYPNRFGFDEYCLWWLMGKGNRYGRPSGFVANGKAMSLKADDYGPDVVCDFMLDFITRHKNSPFLCYYPMILTHSPYVPTPDSKSGTKRNFVDMVHYTDKLVARIVAHLKKLGLFENTVILFTGDNGTGGTISSTLVGRAFKGGKGKMNLHGTHVPLVASWPAGGAKGVTTSAPIDFTAFFPTLLDLAHATPPAGVKLDGASFAPILRNDKDHTPRNWAYVSYYGRERSNMPAQAAIDDRFWMTGEGRLYDFIRDSDLTSPIPTSDTSPPVAAARKKLSGVLKQMAAEIAKENARFASRTDLKGVDRYHPLGSAGKSNTDVRPSKKKRKKRRAKLRE